MTTINPDRLAELDVLYAAMTPGTRHLMAGMPTNVLTDGGLRVARCDFDGTANAEAEANARGIVALHNDYPALSAALRAAWARLAEDPYKTMAAAAATYFEDRNELKQQARESAARVAELEAELATLKGERP